MALTLWLVRHTPVLAAPGLCYGASDLPTDAQATQAAARALLPQLPAGVVVRSSPLQRCERLAQAARALQPDLTYKIDPRLREMDFGAWEGQPWDAIPRADFEAWTNDFAHARPGRHGETVTEVMQRVASAWDEARARRGDTLWVTHGGVMRAALLWSRGVRLPATAADWPRDVLGFGQVIQLVLG